MKIERDQLILDNIGLVHHIAAKYNSIDDDDAISEGTIGLMQAADRFDSERGLKFSTYAYSYINGHMLNYFSKRTFELSLDKEIGDDGFTILDTIEDEYDFEADIISHEVDDVRLRVIKEVVEQNFIYTSILPTLPTLYLRYLSCPSFVILSSEFNVTIARIKQIITKIERMLKVELPKHPLYEECKK